MRDGWTWRGNAGLRFHFRWCLRDRQREKRWILWIQEEIPSQDSVRTPPELLYSSIYSKGSGGSGSCSSSSILGPWAETGSTSSSSSSLVSFIMMMPPVWSWWQTHVSLHSSRNGNTPCNDKIHKLIFTFKLTQKTGRFTLTGVLSTDIQ